MMGGASDDELSGKVYAIDKDEARLSILKKRTSRSRAKIVEPVLSDLLGGTARVAKIFQSANAVVLDPSCTGSGLYNREDVFDTEKKDLQSRLESLAAFQSQALRLALSYSNITRV
eukprot:Plantae.Rhodophyta-Rhodochaete_pulchella.ctg5872.p7 GENE.Plantae.Rhodophyta-Rhodochaete_pulchella.ctg5872~~Plantae.Rhodophyta-Rhodochaete_pulchella.ctg5872.p7  ORF type:complete len:116 (-),score=20.50 Plantae.Rhodophyta-Rhodochaete_pulchella.ctg5872:735-1082(-)